MNNLYVKDYILSMYHNCHFSENICLNLSHVNLNHALYGLIPVINEGFLS